MKRKTIILTIGLSIGFALSNCCDCPPYLEFFDIQGVEVLNLKKREGSGIEALSENEQVSFSNYSSLIIDFQVEYHSSNCNHNKWNFSLMNSALACSCNFDGESGSKEEKLNSLTILTLNDFDPDHLANDTINDLFDVSIFREVIDLEAFIQQDTSLIEEESISLFLKKAPELNNEFKVKVILELSTNEKYEAESLPILIAD